MPSLARILFGATVLLALAPPVGAANLTFATDRQPSSPAPYFLSANGVLEIRIDPARGDTLTFPSSVFIRGPLTITAVDNTDVEVFIGGSLIAAGPSIVKNSASLTLVASVGVVPLGSPLLLTYAPTNVLHHSDRSEEGDVSGTIGGFPGAPSPSPIPEPSSLLLLTSGLTGLALRRRHCRASGDEDDLPVSTSSSRERARSGRPRRRSPVRAPSPRRART